MEQSSSRDTTLPLVVRVVGLKKSGKTTVAQAVIRELVSRGVCVGALKVTSHERLSLDPEGTDTGLLAEAGAGVVLAVLPGQTARFERTAARSVEQIAWLYPTGTDVVVCEGSLPWQGESRTIVCVSAVSDLERTLSIRGLLLEPIAAISGIGASGASLGGALQWRGEMVPVVDALSPEGGRALGEIVAPQRGRPEQERFR